MNELIAHFNQNNFVLNINKNSVLHFSNRINNTRQLPKIDVNDCPVEESLSNKFLVAILDSKLNWSSHIRVIWKVNFLKVYVLKNLIGRSPDEVKLAAYFGLFCIRHTFFF